jgi:hypothetical protein
LAEPIRKAILDVDADQPVSNIRTLGQDIARSVAARRHTLTLLVLQRQLGFGAWIFSGAWCLVFGVLPIADH